MKPIFNQQAITRILPAKACNIKLFAFESPIYADRLVSLGLYRERALTDDLFCLDLLNVLKQPHGNRYDEKLNTAIAELTSLYKETVVEVSLRDIISEYIGFVSAIQKELTKHHFYQNGYLNFNALWFEGNDTIILFKVDHTDV